jgi:hypothetical protein
VLDESVDNSQFVLREIWGLFACLGIAFSVRYVFFWEVGMAYDPFSPFTPSEQGLFETNRRLGEHMKRSVEESARNVQRMKERAAPPVIPDFGPYTSQSPSVKPSRPPNAFSRAIDAVSEAIRKIVDAIKFVLALVLAALGAGFWIVLIYAVITG